MIDSIGSVRRFFGFSRVIRSLKSHPLIIIPISVILIITALWAFTRIFLLIYGPLPDLNITVLKTDSDWDWQHYQKDYMFDNGPFAAHIGRAWSSRDTPPPHFVLMEFDRDYKIDLMQIYNRDPIRLETISVHVVDANGEHLLFNKTGLSEVNPIEVPLGTTPIRSIRIDIIESRLNGKPRNSADIGKIVFPGFHANLLH